MLPSAALPGAQVLVNPLGTDYAVGLSKIFLEIWLWGNQGGSPWLDNQLMCDPTETQDVVLNILYFR